MDKENLSGFLKVRKSWDKQLGWSQSGCPGWSQLDDQQLDTRSAYILILFSCLCFVAFRAVGVDSSALRALRFLDLPLTNVSMLCCSTKTFIFPSPPGWESLTMSKERNFKNKKHPNFQKTLAAFNSFFFHKSKDILWFISVSSSPPLPVEVNTPQKRTPISFFILFLKVQRILGFLAELSHRHHLSHSQIAGEQRHLSG